MYRKSKSYRHHDKQLWLYQDKGDSPKRCYTYAPTAVVKTKTVLFDASSIEVTLFFEMNPLVQTAFGLIILGDLVENSNFFILFLPFICSHFPAWYLQILSLCFFSPFPPFFHYLENFCIFCGCKNNVQIIHSYYNLCKSENKQTSTVKAPINQMKLVHVPIMISHSMLHLLGSPT